MKIMTNCGKKLGIVQKSFGNLQFVYREATVDEQVLTKMYQMHRFFPEDYKPTGTDTILDVGAHIGVFSVIAARQNPRGKVYAIEASEENFELLVKNISLNNLKHVSAYRNALAGCNGQATLFYHAENWAHTLCTQSIESVERSECVMVETLDYFFKRNAISKIDYAKMNVEGAEYEIILSSAPSVLRRIRCMHIEFHPSTDYDELMLVKRLEKYGFQIKVIWSDDEECKGWLTARVQY